MKETRVMYCLVLWVRAVARINSFEGGAAKLDTVHF